MARRDSLFAGPQRIAQLCALLAGSILTSAGCSTASETDGDDMIPLDGTIGLDPDQEPQLGVLIHIASHNIQCGQTSSAQLGCGQWLVELHLPELTSYTPGQPSMSYSLSSLVPPTVTVVQALPECEVITGTFSDGQLKFHHEPELHIEISDVGDKALGVPLDGLHKLNSCY